MELKKLKELKELKTIGDEEMSSKEIKEDSRFQRQKLKDNTLVKWL